MRNLGRLLTPIFKHLKTRSLHLVVRIWLIPENWPLATVATSVSGICPGKRSHGVHSWITSPILSSNLGSIGFQCYCVDRGVEECRGLQRSDRSWWTLDSPRAARQIWFNSPCLTLTRREVITKFVSWAPRCSLYGPKHLRPIQPSSHRHQSFMAW